MSCDRAHRVNTHQGEQMLHEPPGKGVWREDCKIAPATRQNLTALALEFAHETDQRLDRGRLDGIVERNAHAADGTVAGRAGEARSSSLFAEFFFGAFVGVCCGGLAVGAGHTKDHVHLRTRIFLHRAVVKAVAGVYGVVEQLCFGVISLLDSGQAAVRLDPFHHQADDVDREGRRRVIKRLFLDVGAVLKNGWQIFVGALGQILAYDDDGGAGRAEIFLCAGENQTELSDVQRARGDVRRHISDEWNFTSVRKRVVLRAFDGVVGTEIDVGSIGAQRDFLLARNASVFHGFSVGGDAMRDAFFELGEGFGGPGSRVQNVHWLARQAQIHWYQGELSAAATLQKDYGVIIGNRQMLAQAGFGGGVDAFKFGRTMAHFHHGHAGAAPVEELFADALENGKREGAGAGVEVVDALNSTGGCRTG